MGLSRASRGISPEILYNSLKKLSPYKFKNIAFSSNTSNYDEEYCNYCKQFIRNKKRNHIFILSVNPGVFNKNTNEYSLFKKRGQSLLNLLEILICTDVNIFYKKLTNQQYDTLSQQGQVIGVNIKNNKLQMLNAYKNTIISDIYIANLKKMTIYLKQFGEVIFVRIPISTENKAIENKLFPKFDNIIKALSQETGAKYINYINNDTYKTYDGSHLYPSCAKEFSINLSRQIINKLN